MGSPCGGMLKRTTQAPPFFTCSISFRPLPHTLWTIEWLPSLKSRGNVVEGLPASTCLCESFNGDAAPKNVEENTVRCGCFPRAASHSGHSFTQLSPECITVHVTA